jgi:FAD-dependent urate hydroxylase
VDPRSVALIEATRSGFSLKLEDGETVTTRRVVIASGILPFAWRPPEFKGIPTQLAPHSSEIRDLGRFAGKRVLVVGGGQSALESAALLHEVGAEVEVIVRNPEVIWLHKRPFLHSWPLSQMLYAWPDVGPALISHLVARPEWFKSLPRKFQDKLCPRIVRPAGAQWLKPRVHNVLPISVSRMVKRVVHSATEIRITLDDGTERKVDQVILATGYRVSIDLYSFLSAKLLAAIRRVDGYPELNAGFESSVPGLHFLGAPAAWSFGPLMRFVAGADFATRALARSVASNHAGNR